MGSYFEPQHAGRRPLVCGLIPSRLLVIPVPNRDRLIFGVLTSSNSAVAHGIDDVTLTLNIVHTQPFSVKCHALSISVPFHFWLRAAALAFAAASLDIYRKSLHSEIQASILRSRLRSRHRRFDVPLLGFDVRLGGFDLDIDASMCHF